jgi:hypothetical protein
VKNRGPRRFRLVLVLAAGVLIFAGRAEAGVITATGTSFSAVAEISFSGTVATFTDSDTTLTAADYTALINWGDLSSSAGTVVGGGGSFTVTGSHTYASGGSFTTTITITVPNLFVARLIGTNEVPPNASTGTGVGTAVLNSSHTAITVNLSFSGLSAPATAAHIHGPAPAGVNAAVIFPLAGVPAATSGTVPQQSFSVTPTQLADLQAGLLYMNVHTSNFPGGEIRDQLNAEAATARGTATVIALPAVPTLNERGMLIFGLLVAGAGLLLLVRRR